MISRNMSLPKFDLRGKSALITGGAGLLGKEHAFALLEVGANVVLWDVNSENLIRVTNELTKDFSERSIKMSVVDISKEEEVRNAYEELELQGITISILINNAAINPKYNSDSKEKVFSRVEKLTLDDWNYQLSVGLTGAFICTKYFGNKMAINNGGVILNISSDLSVISPDQRLYKVSGTDEDSQPVKPITYSVIKSGLVGMTKYLATYWSANGVRVNALSPGGVYEEQNSDFVKKISELIPLGRMAKSNEYRSAVQFLCSDASAYMTGQNIVIDGGRSVW
jgi:NAD(P)-dependent dehydrogenase (short-subunit alcohol dehydrogenase family)